MTVTAYRTAEHILFGIAMCLIFLALTLIFTKSRKEIGQYRKLLVIFLISGHFFALLHVILSPTAIIRDNAFITYGSGWIGDMRFIALYYGVVSMSFIILAMQFLYRAVVLSRKTNLQCGNHQQKYSRNNCYSDSETGGVDDPLHYAALQTRVDNKLNVVPFLIILSMLLLCGVSLSIIIWSSVRIVRVLNNEEHLSSSWRKYNRQLFVALCLQFLGPLILLYIPCISYLLLPFVPGHGISPPPWLLSFFYSIYPIVDPLVMIVFIRDYRRGLLNLLRRAVFLGPLNGSVVVISGNSRQRNSNK